MLPEKACDSLPMTLSPICDVHPRAEAVELLRPGDGFVDVREVDLRGDRERDFLHLAAEREQVLVAERTGTVGELNADPDPRVAGLGADRTPERPRFVVALPVHRPDQSFIEERLGMPGEVGAGDRPCAIQLHDVVDARIEARRGQGCGRRFRLLLRRRPVDDDRVLDGAVDPGCLGHWHADGSGWCGRRPAAPEQRIVMP